MLPQQKFVYCMVQHPVFAKVLTKNIRCYAVHETLLQFDPSGFWIGQLRIRKGAKALLEFELVVQFVLLLSIQDRQVHYEFQKGVRLIGIQC